MAQKPSSVKAWWKRVEDAKASRQRHVGTWDLLVEAYKPTVTKSGTPEDVKSNAHFRNVEYKKSLLFFQNPELRLLAKEPMQAPLVNPQTGQPFTDQTGQPVTGEGAVTIHEEVLNYYLGPDEVDLPLLVDRLLFDCLCPTGFMVSKIGYRPYIQDVKEPVMEPAVSEMGEVILDAQGQPELQPTLDEKGRPVMESVPVVVKEEYFWNRVSPRKLLIPKEFKDTDFRKAPWLGLEFTMPLRDAKLLFPLPKDFEATQGRDDQLIGANNRIQGGQDQVVKGVEIWYKAHLYRDEVVHPEIYWQLVLIENHRDSRGALTAVKDEMSPYQTLDETTLRLTADSMIGNPIHVGTIRDLTDESYVPSDCAMTHTLVKEIDTHRQQTVKGRDANLTKYGYDVDRLTPEALEQFQRGDVGDLVPLQGGAMSGGIDKVIAPFTKATSSRVEADVAFHLENDLEKTLSISANQTGSVNSGARTATELSIIQQNSNARIKKEQQRVLSYVLSGVRKFDALLQRFADETDYVRIVGDDNLPRLQAWNRHLIAGRFAYTILPDSQLDLDTATERSLWVEFYNLTAQDPFNNRKESLKRLQRLYGLDPAKALIEPPPPGPPPPNVSFRFSGDDLVGPAAPIVREIVAQAGYQISPQSIQEADTLMAAQTLQESMQPGVDGTAERIPPVSKRQEGLTGEISGPTEQSKP